MLALVHELLRAGLVDVDYLIRYTNAPWLVIQNPGGADDGLFLRDRRRPGRSAGTARPVGCARQTTPALRPDLKGVVTLPRGQRARPVFELLAERYLDPALQSRRRGRRRPAFRPQRSAGSRPSWRRPPSTEPLVLDQPWTDAWGRRHQEMIGRPVSMHAMRGISAHANGFHTCRALHLLQVLLGSIDAPGGFRYKPPFPKPIPPAPKPAGKADEIAPGEPMAGPPLGFPSGPEDLLVEADGTPRRIDKAFSWEAPLAAHGLMHLVISNAARGDPYPIDTLFLYMTNMAWNSAMNVGGTIAMLTARDPASGEYRIPRIIYSDAYFSEMVAYADLILPDTTYLERWDCISLLDRPIGSADGPADSIRQPVLAPDRDVRPFQDVLLDLGHRLGLPGMTKEDGSPKFPKGYADYIVHHERQPGIGSLAGWRGADGKEKGRGEPNPDQLQRYIEQRLLLARRDRARSPLLQARQSRLARLRRAHGLHRQGRADRPPALQRGPAAVPPRRARSRQGASRPSAPGRASRPISTRCRSGIRPSRTGQTSSRAFRFTRSPSDRWPCTTPGAR